MSRIARLALSAAVVTACVLPGLRAHAASPCADAGGGWLSSAPSFTVGPAEVRLLAAPAYAPDVLYASNGSAVARSDDGGCSWSTVYAPAAAPGGSATITALSAPSSASGSTTVYAGLTTVVGGLELPAVAMSKDRGLNWTRSEPQSGLAVLGTVRQVVASPTLPQVAYAVVSVTVSGTTRSSIYATNDGGTSWAARTAPTDDFGGADLHADALAQTRLFAVRGTRVVASQDGGGSFEALAGAEGPVGPLSLASGGGGSRLVAGRADRDAALRSDDGGQSWRSVPLRLRPRVIAMAPVRDLFASADATDVDLSGTFGTVRVSPRGGAPVQLTVSAPTATGFAVAGLARGKLLRAVFALGPGGPPTVVAPVGLRPVRLLPRAAAGTFPSVLQPAALTLTLPAGGRAQVPYSLLVPRTPTPVDLMFVIDTTGSMGGVIDGLRQDLGKIVDAVNGAGLDARFGLAEFRDYPDGAADDYPYRLDAVIGPREAMGAALNRLTVGGGGDGPEAGLTALLQSTTGQGQRPWVARGLQARYRPGAFKFVLSSTDNPFHRKGDAYGSGLWPGPSMEEVIRALAGHGVHQIGLAAGSTAEPDMKLLARGSRALAPDGGVDCNGDGVPDVASGGPLVCPVYDTAGDASGGLVGVGATGGGGVALSGAVVSVVNGIEDRQPLRLGVTEGASVARFRRASATTVNLKADNALSDLLELHCPAAGRSTHHVAVAGSTAHRVLAAGEVQLSCGGPPPPPAPGLAAPVAAAGQAAAPGPGQPVTQPGTNPQPNPNPNVNPNVNVNGAVSEQEQPESQVALAEADSGRTEEIAFVGTAGLLLASAAGVAARRQTQAACAPR